MVRLRGAQVVGPDGVLEPGAVVIDGGRLAAVTIDSGEALAAGDIDCRGCWIVPGFIDTHHHLFETALRDVAATVTGADGLALLRDAQASA